MDHTFRDQIQKLKLLDEKLARLFAQHQQYEEELEKLDRRKFRTQDEEARVKVIKFAKARGKEQMAWIAQKYQKAA